MQEENLPPSEKNRLYDPIAHCKYTLAGTPNTINPQPWNPLSTLSYYECSIKVPHNLIQTTVDDINPGV